ncbi:hypothetical protein [Cellulomonas chengniuliangii]|uniref:hypothetical protein n=1 Tax=Cellulomonas chengniuliangii TaxID=2968084 RepID=UPI001D0F44A7|nr:hypothetical protein [Cellulomonas chengniuliangii]MCC2307897.1 hypothetical protein [Cellulomonas chengniuliangii]
MNTIIDDTGPRTGPCRGIFVRGLGRFPRGVRDQWWKGDGLALAPLRLGAVTARLIIAAIAQRVHGGRAEHVELRHRVHVSGGAVQASRICGYPVLVSAVLVSPALILVGDRAGFPREGIAVVSPPRHVGVVACFTWNVGHTIPVGLSRHRICGGEFAAAVDG